MQKINTSRDWVELALKTLSCNQKDLARRVGVSETQISKWKSGDHMSPNMENKFGGIVKVGDQHPGFVLWAGSHEDADKWERLIHFLAKEAQEDGETRYKAEPLEKDFGQLCWKVSDTLAGLGVEPPEGFPADLDPYFNDQSDDENNHDEALWDLLATNSYSSLIRAIFESLVKVCGFYTAYVRDVADDEGGSLFATKSNIEARIMDLAACMIEVDEKFAHKVSTFRHRVTNEYKEWLTKVQEAAFRTGTPLRAELLDMIGYNAEALGENANRLHPDIYMNELLVGMRSIHKALPAILKQLDIRDFEPDESTFLPTSAHVAPMRMQPPRRRPVPASPQPRRR